MEETSKKVAISIKNLHKSYGDKKVLKGINLEVYENEMFGFLGRNGIGQFKVTATHKSQNVDTITVTAAGDEYSWYVLQF